MYVTSLKFYSSAFDDEMVVSLTRLNMSALDNALKFYFAVAYLECVSGGRKILVMSYLSDMSFLYGGQILFVDRYWQKEKRMASQHF